MAFKCHRSPRHQPPDHNTGQQQPPAKVVDEKQKRPGRAARVPAGAPVKHAVAQGKEQRREKIPGTDGADLRRDPRQQRPQKGNGIPHPGKDKRQLPLTLPAAAAVAGEQRLRRISQHRHKAQQQNGGDQLPDRAEGLRPPEIQDEQQGGHHHRRDGYDPDQTGQFFLGCFCGFHAVPPPEG